MGYIPADAKWYLADVVMAIRVGDAEQYVVHVNIHLVRADSPDEAHQKALALGREGEMTYANPAGEMVRFEFLGLRDLNVIHGELEDGVEITYNHYDALTRAEAEALVYAPAALGVFEPMKTPSGPDYTCGEVLAEATALVAQLRDALRLTTDRLVLEPLVAAHADALYAGLADPRLYAFVADLPPESRERLRRRYTRLETRWSPDHAERWLNWAVRVADGPYVGTVEATVRRDQRASVAYFVFSEFARRGYGAEATRAVVGYLVDALRVSGIEARIDTGNVASQRLAERVGFVRVRTEPDADAFKGRSSDEHVYEWPIGGT
jgi:RimJ/RimL family protein N-acetyltransferase